MNHQFIARYCNSTLTGGSFTEVGDQLISKGFDMTLAYDKGDGVLCVPHVKSSNVTAKVFRKPVHEEPAKPIPVQADLAKAIAAGAKVASGDGIKHMRTRQCGAVHPEGVICVLMVFAERPCCVDVIYPHEGPHEVHRDGMVTHRWITEMVITDLPFNGYGEYVDEDEEVG
jgi:hypothetical protein